MKILIGGAGNVGRSIVDYLSQANNDIIVTDTNKERLDELLGENREIELSAKDNIEK